MRFQVAGEVKEVVVRAVKAECDGDGLEVAVLLGIFDAGAVDANVVTGGVLADELEGVAGVEFAWQGGFEAGAFGCECV